MSACSRLWARDNGLGVPAGSELRAATGPAYGRIWDADSLTRSSSARRWRLRALARAGRVRQPHHCHQENTTLFASDRDMFVFLADEDRRIEVPDRRNGSGGSMARGFFVWNSEVGDKTLGLGFFLFDYVCQNRIVRAPTSTPRVRIRHTKAHRCWLEEVAPCSRSTTRVGPAGHQGDRGRPGAKGPGRPGCVPRTAVRQEHGGANQGDPSGRRGRPIETLWT